MPQPQQPNPWRYAHLGLELAGAIVVLALVGLWVDYRWGTGPWGLLVGVLVGAVGGLYLFIKDALAATRQFQHGGGAKQGVSEDARDVSPSASGRDAGDNQGRDEPNESDAADRPESSERSGAPQRRASANPDETDDT